MDEISSLIQRIENLITGNPVSDALKAQAEAAIATGQDALKLFSEGGILNDAKAAVEAAEAIQELSAVVAALAVSAGVAA